MPGFFFGFGLFVTKNKGYSNKGIAPGKVS